MYCEGHRMCLLVLCVILNVSVCLVVIVIENKIAIFYSVITHNKIGFKLQKTFTVLKCLSTYDLYVFICLITFT